jgi:predicted nucleic acid-binding protein
VKLPLREAGHEALRRELSKWDGYVSSSLLGVESVRACARYGPGYAALARSWLEGVALLPLDDAILDTATALEPQALRSLDAVHLATAVSVSEDIGAFVAYDERLCDAARRCGLRTAPK